MKPTDLRPAGSAEIALRLHAGLGAHAVVLVSNEREAADAAASLAVDMAALANLSTKRVAGTSIEALVTREHGDGVEPVTLVTDTEALTIEDWQRIDGLRSRLPTCVWIVAPTTFSKIQRHAPNLASWFGDALAWAANTDHLTDAERQLRIAALERWAGFGSATLIEKSSAGALPDEPEYREWLLLVDRGDLLAH